MNTYTAADISRGLPAPKPSRAFIYGLVDPATGSIRYIGKTVNPRVRFTTHLLATGKRGKCAWVERMVACGECPLMVIIEECDRSDVAAREKFWIAFGDRAGWMLFNLKDNTDRETYYDDTPEQQAANDAHDVMIRAAAEHMRN